MRALSESIATADASTRIKAAARTLIEAAASILDEVTAMATATVLPPPPSPTMGGGHRMRLPYVKTPLLQDTAITERGEIAVIFTLFHRGTLALRLKIAAHSTLGAAMPLLAGSSLRFKAALDASGALDGLALPTLRAMDARVCFGTLLKETREAFILHDSKAARMKRLTRMVQLMEIIEQAL